ncbi:Collagenase NC10/endostatin, partial [Trinorchestia longiramus]
GETILSSWQDLSLSGGLFLEAPKIFSFDGNNIAESERWPNKYVWHGATRRGEKADNCNAWTSSSAIRVGHASSLQSMQLLAQEKIACDNRLAALCIETNLPKRRKRSLRRRRRSVLHHTNVSVVPEAFLWDSEVQVMGKKVVRESQDVGIHGGSYPEDDVRIEMKVSPVNVSGSLVHKPVGPPITKDSEEVLEPVNSSNIGKINISPKESSEISDSGGKLNSEPIPSPHLDENFHQEREERRKLVNKKIIEMMDLMESED